MMTAPPTDLLEAAAIEVEIANLLRKYRRMPAHWEARRIQTMKAIDDLIDQWLELKHRQPERT